MRFKKYCLSFWLTITAISAFAQTDTTFLLRAASSLPAYFNNHPIEKVYLHTDKAYYLPGDTIWFKAYDVVGEHHQLSALSGVLYVELISPKDSVIGNHVLHLTVGNAMGDFALNRSLKAGDYRIRAYTNWMRNAGSDYFFTATIHVGGMRTSLSLQNSAIKNKPDVQFFPEGGELVNGLRSKVAVKAINVAGLGEDVKGTITDNDGNEVAAFSTQHLGMGIFALTPQPGKVYKANIITRDSSKFTVDLPKVTDEGFTLTINNNDADSILIKVAANAQLFGKKQDASFYLVGQSAGKVYYTSVLKLATSVFIAHVPKDRFPSGIAQFTLFSQNGEPLNERIIFVKNNDDLNISLSAGADTYKTREKVKISIDTKNNGSATSEGIFSASVINENRVPVNESSEVTILNYLLLTSDLKGYIEQPNYYFTTIDAQRRADLDVLMLTQGYRRFEWMDVLNNVNKPVAWQQEKALEFAGTLKTPSGKPVPNGKVILTAPRENLLTDTVTDAEGNFRFTNINVSDTSKIVLRARKAHNGSNVAIFVKQKEFPAVKKNTITDVEATGILTPEMLKHIADYRERQRQDSIKNSRQLTGVVIGAKKTPKPDEYNGYGTALEQELDMKRVHDYTNVREALRALAPGFKSPRLVIDGLEFKYVIPEVSIDEIQSIRVVAPNGYDSDLHRFDERGYAIITTRKYAGMDTTVLKEVVIKAKKDNKPDLSRSSNLHGGGNADQVIMGDILSGCVKLSECLQGKVFGVTFRNGTPYSIRTQGRLSGQPAMVLIIDGIQLDGSSLDDLNANDIYSIEVLRSGAYLAVYGSDAPGGALVITTRRGGDPKYVTSETPAGLILYPFKGYYKGKTFYSPKYTHAKTDDEQPDLRPTVYWNPNILTGKDGKASIEYYNNDSKGSYRVVVEGIDDNGNIGRAILRYKVE